MLVHDFKGLTLDNRMQICANSFKKICLDLQIKQSFASVEHPQMNSLVESTNQIILKGLKMRLDLTKEGWVQ